MTDNHLYNLMHELVKENEALWHIKKSYFDDADSCDHCQDFWKKTVSQKEAAIKELEAMVKNHMS